MIKKPLTEAQIEEICSSINCHYTEDFVSENSRVVLRKQLKSIEIYPEVYNTLKNEIIRQYNRSWINPCEMVGCIASTSIGETTTQASLNSFHASGQAKANLTTGVVRLKELLSATKNNKTPSLTLYFKNKANDLKAIRKLCQTQVEQTLMRDLITDYEIEKDPNITEKWYDHFSKIYDDGYKNCDWRLRLHLNFDRLWLCKKSLMTIVEICESNLNSEDGLSYVFSPLHIGIIDIWCNSDSIPSVDDTASAKDLDEDEVEMLREHLVDDVPARLFLKNVVLGHLKNVIVSGIKDVEKCYYSQLKGDNYYVETKGGNLIDVLWIRPPSRQEELTIDLEKSHSNNMWEILQLYGIEATVQFLHMEFAKIISVSKRHLDVLIDWMTSTGTLASVSRYGVDIAKVGPMAKASFEQPLEAFFEAAHTAQRDEITGVSAAVATGVLANGGTGGFNVLLKTKSLPAYEEVQKPKLSSHILKTKVTEHYEEEKLEDIEMPQDEFIIEEEPDEDEEVLGYD